MSSRILPPQTAAYFPRPVYALSINGRPGDGLFVMSNGTLAVGFQDQAVGVLLGLQELRELGELLLILAAEQEAAASAAVAQLERIAATAGRSQEASP